MPKIPTGDLDDAELDAELPYVRKVAFGDVTLYQGDCLKILPLIPWHAAVVSDPPYGISNNCNYTRFTNGLSDYGNFADGIANDDKPFDPTPWLRFGRCCLFGFNCFSDKLPLGSLLIWCKKSDASLGKFLSDCEVAWMKGGNGIYLFHHVWNGFDRESEKGKTLHPSQKPVALMRWVMELMKVPKNATVVDPYMGSGATGLACIETGRWFIGVEIEPTYLDVAHRRIRMAVEGHDGLYMEVAPPTPKRIMFGKASTNGCME